MLKAKVFFVLAALFFSSEAQALIRADFPRTVKQGDVVKVYVTDQTPGTHEVHYCPPGWSGTAECLKVEAVQLANSVELALIPISADTVPGLGLISVFSAREAYSYALNIESANFPEAKGTTFVGELKGKLLARFNAEKAELKKIFSERSQKRYWKDDLGFYAPLSNMELTSPFGQIRHKYSAKYGRWDINHFGADLRADSGTEVYSVDYGIVRLARSLLAEGNTVIIDHGNGLLSLYFHLSRILVKEGDVVMRRDLIALSGQTASSAPHLHFEIRLYGVAVSPWNFMPEPLPAEPRIAEPARRRRGVK